MRIICIISLLLMTIASPTKANTLKCNFFFKNVAGSPLFTRALFVPENDPYRVDFSLAEISFSPPKGESALSWETPFINDRLIFFKTSIYPRVKEYPRTVGNIVITTTSLDWTLSNFRLPWGPTSSVNFHVSIKTRGDETYEVTMDAMSDIDPSAYFAASGECKKGSAEVKRVLKSESKTSASSSSTNSKLNKVKSTCTELGFRSGTEKHGDCVMKLLDN
jgi:hypothetical protein